jgi:hypothetical protein
MIGRNARRREAIANARRRIRERRAEFVKEGFTVRTSVKFISTSKINYARFGRRFCETFRAQRFQGRNQRTYNINLSQFGVFESDRELSVTCTLPSEQAAKFDSEQFGHLGRVQITVNLGNMPIGFERDSLIVEAIKGTSKRFNPLANDFWRTTKQKPLDKLLEEAEKQAQTLGFSEIKIRRPETLYYYETPWVTEPEMLPPNWVEIKAKKQREIRANMRILYGRIARNHHYTKEEFYYVKKL